MEHSPVLSYLAQGLHSSLAAVSKLGVPNWLFPSGTLGSPVSELRQEKTP